MNQVLQPPTPLFAPRGGTSIKSFESRSIGGDSTRRKTFGIAGLLGRRKNQPLPDLNSLVLAEKLLDAEPREPSENVDPGLRPSRPAPSTAAANKQSSGLFRKLTTKLNPKRPTSPPRNQRRSVEAQEARNAALRERGLLPPLPLSVQEAQQDSRIAIVASEPGQQSGLERRTTAANRVKEEWEAKNRERLNDFRFGGNSPAASHRQENFPATGLGAVTEVETPLPSPAAQDSPSEFGPVADELEAKAPRAPPPTLNLGRERPGRSDTPPDPAFLPLPPRPTPGTESNVSSLVPAFTSTPAADAGFIPLSLSFPLPPSAPFSDPSLHSIRDRTETPQAKYDCTTPALLPPPSRAQSTPRIDASESESTLGVPSLVNSESQTTMSTSDSLGSFGRMGSAPLAPKVRNNTFEPQDSANDAISVTVESPPQNRDRDILSESPVNEDPQQTALAQPSEKPPAARVPLRRTTDPLPPVAQLERRTTLSVLKKMSLRRPTGLGRSKTSAKAPASKMPPSPTLPGSFTGQQRTRVRPAGAGHQHRSSAGVSPTMHNAGTILSEMNKIEDEESRRMTELAFM
ncbi:hypothetical protein K438DRAFT_2028771 [Mycena galopus ATCC 62051]|nr:hypothetical protein K438DRAFT_2028771 [Mycena galopus ATCC 62051]